MYRIPRARTSFWASSIVGAAAIVSAASNPSRLSGAKEPIPLKPP